MGGGHSAVGRARYDERIAETLSRCALESREAQLWADATADRRFRPSPHAARPTRALLSLPLFRGDEVVGVVNAVSSQAGVFHAAEVAYLAALTGAISVALEAA